MSDEENHDHDHGPSFFSFPFQFGTPPTPEEIERDNMQQDSNRHETRQFFDGLKEDQLQKLSFIIGSVITTQGSAGIFYQGLISGLLDQKFGKCLACDKKHDDEIEKFIGHPPIAKAIPKDIRAQNSDSPAKGSQEYDRLMFLYNMEQDDNGSDRVRCKGCGTWLESLQDRMLRPTGIPGCEVCKDKQKWG